MRYCNQIPLCIIEINIQLLMNKPCGIILLLLTLLQISTNNTVNQLSQLFSNIPQELSYNQPIFVELTSTHYPQTNIKAHYYFLRVVHKQKKEAYERLKDMLNKIANILIHNKAIPHQQSLPKSKISHTYLSKKRSWSFTNFFVVLGSEQQLEMYHRKMHGLKIQRLSKAPQVSIPYHKIQLLNIFSKAKQTLLKELQKFPHLQIQEITQLQHNYSKQQQYQNQNDSSPSLSEDQTSSTIHSQQEKPKSPKIVFKVGRVSSNEHQQESEGDYDEEQNQSRESDESYVSF